MRLFYVLGIDLIAFYQLEEEFEFQLREVFVFFFVDINDFIMRRILE